ncbi:MAG TPA: hypothetical protein PL066_02030 [bacterium]|nr:hypothetical protein [bacterium]
MNKKLFIEIIGWYGALAIIGAYFLNSFSFISAYDLSYQILNVTGALGMIAVSFYKKAYQPMTVNIVWAAIGGLAIINLFL